MEGPYINDFEALAAVEISKIDKQMAKEYLRLVSEAAGRGILDSSAAMQMVHRATVHTLPVRAQTAFNILMRSMEAHGVPIVSANKDEVAGFLAAWIDDQRAKAEAKMLGTVPFKRKSVENWANPLLDDLKEIAVAESQRLAGELNLIAARNSRIVKDNADGGSSIVFNGPVGLVQTGAGSFGVAQQNIDGATKASLIEALDKLLEEIDQANGEFEFDPSEVRAVALEAKAEVAKEKPSALRLRGLISGIGGAISYVPKLKTAYETLKWAAKFIGVDLP